MWSYNYIIREQYYLLIFRFGEKMLDGYKTYLGGLGAIFIGVGKALHDWYIGNPVNFEEYLQWLIAGWVIIGGRSAFEKSQK